MIDLEAAKALAVAGAPNDGVTVSRRWLKQAVDEIAKGRSRAQGQAKK